MKLAAASALILVICAGNASAFSAAPSSANDFRSTSSSALRSTAATKTYTFTKSEEIFAEAKTVSLSSFLGTTAGVHVILYLSKGHWVRANFCTEIMG